MSRYVATSCMVGYEGHRGWVHYLAVSPKLQNQGYGRAIMKKAEEILADAGCPKINLQVRTSNQKVIGFYQSMGFRTDDVFSMGKRLEPDEPYQA
ncbi:MAG: GNAT family N-acetyltransferase [Pirellulales bacterium]|nr:GNAT family N-acetyltransferase [Pirellulales bacterium]